MNQIIRTAFLLVLGCSLAYGSFFSQIFAEQVEQVNISKSIGKADLPQIAVLDNDVYIVWRDNTPGNEDIYFTKSPDSGFSFTDPVNLSDNAGPSAFPRLSIVGKNIYSVWYDYTPGQSDIFFAKSLDGGNSFETISLSDNGGVSYNPWVAAHENNVYVVWNDETPNLNTLNITKPKNIDVALVPLSILVATSHDGGSAFDVSKLSDSQFDSWNPRISVYQNYVYVVWNQKTQTGNEIFFAVSNDSGETFSKPINLSNSAAGSLDAGIEASDDNVYVIWQESESGTNNIFFTMSDNNGNSFSNPIKISNDGSAELTRDTQIIASQNNVYIVWFDKSAEGGTFFVRSDDFGRAFSKPINLSGKVPNVAMAQITSYQDDLYVIWQDSRLGNGDVFLRKSTDKGKSFGSTVNISHDESESNLSILGPQVAAVNDKVYTIFEKINESGSDLYVDQRSKVKSVQNGTLILQTIDGAINVETNFDKETIDKDEPVNINLKFFDASTNQPLNQVNYSLSIDDVQGNSIVPLQNLFVESGMDNQTVTFDKSGPYTITISVHEIGSNTFSDSDYSRTTNGIITVIPEFPVGTLIVIIIGLALGLILNKSSVLIKNKMNSYSQL